MCKKRVYDTKTARGNQAQISRKMRFSNRAGHLLYCKRGSPPNKALLAVDQDFVQAKTVSVRARLASDPDVLGLYVFLHEIDLVQTDAPLVSYAERLQQDSSVTMSQGFACRLIHSRIRLTVFVCCASESGTPRPTLHHFSIQPRQQQAVACIALNTGCPRIGVCRPSFAGTAAESFARTKSAFGFVWRLQTGCSISAV